MDTAVKPSLTIKRRLKAPPEKVFAAWIDPEKVKLWMGPGEIKPILADADPRVGGRYRWLMCSPEGNEHDVSGVYREVVANEKLVFTWAWKSSPEQETLVTVLFEPDGNGTLLTLIHEQFADEGSRDSHNQGWTGTLDKMEKLFASQEQVMRGTHGTFYWNELCARNVEGAKKFYAQTMGWSYDAMPMPGGGTYWVAKMNNEPVAGVFDISGHEFDGMPEQWMPYIAVDDVDARARKAVAAGAKVLKPAFDVPGVGRIVILREPGGAGVGWMTPATN